MNLVFYTLSISLFDSLSTAFQIIIFVLLLSTVNPLRNTLSYLAGLSGTYFVCGFAGYFILDELRYLLAQFRPNFDAVPNEVYYLSEFLTGIIIIAIGIGYFFYWKNKKPHGRMISWIVSKLKNMNIWFAFLIGFIFSATTFPFSIPYLMALGKYTTLQLDLPDIFGWILFYNIIYALPMVLILALYLMARRNIDFNHDTLHEHANKLNLHLTAWTIVALGLLFVVDAACYFALGYALFKGRLF